MINFEISNNVPLKDFCTFKIGGSAKFLCVAKDNTQLINVCKYCLTHNIKYKVIGLGANLLFDDLGFDGMIIVNRSANIFFTNSNVYADSGVNVTNLIMKCYFRSIGGLENLSGIPATVGGAIVNSLGAFNTNFSDYVEWVECYHKDNLNKKIILKHDDCKFGYRTSIFKSNDYIITMVKLNLRADEKEIIHQRIINAVTNKNEVQPLSLPSAGSVFKRGNIIPAKVIDELGLKGIKIGGAEISTKHAGFIVNTHSATSQDVMNLIDLIKNEVKDKYNETLDTEIEIVEF